MAGYYPLPVGKCRCGACTPDEQTPNEETAGPNGRENKSRSSGEAARDDA